MPPDIRPLFFDDSHFVQYGDESAVVRMHAGNGVHEETDDRAIACFEAALADTGFAADERLRRVLTDYFTTATRVTLARYPGSGRRRARRADRAALVVGRPTGSE